PDGCHAPAVERDPADARLGATVREQPAAVDRPVPRLDVPDGRQGVPAQVAPGSSLGDLEHRAGVRRERAGRDAGVRGHAGDPGRVDPVGDPDGRVPLGPLGSRRLRGGGRDLGGHDRLDRGRRTPQVTAGDQHRPSPRDRHDRDDDAHQGQRGEETVRRAHAQRRYVAATGAVSAPGATGSPSTPRSRPATVTSTTPGTVARTVTGGGTLSRLRSPSSIGPRCTTVPWPSRTTTRVSALAVRTTFTGLTIGVAGAMSARVSPAEPFRVGEGTSTVPSSPVKIRATPQIRAR